MTDALSSLLATKTNADKIARDRKNFAAYLQDRIEHGWDSVDVAEYRDEVSRIMKSGTADEKAAAASFWELKAAQIIGAAQGINERIRGACVAPSGTC